VIETWLAKLLQGDKRVEEILKILPLRPSLACSALTIVLTFGLATEAHAQGFISPLIGFNFGGDASCPDVTNCQDKRLNYGVSLGVTGAVLGFEEEFAYAKDFFGTSPNYSSSVFTLMTNIMLVPNIGPIRPYGLAGLGLIKTHVELTPASLLTSDNNNLGWDVGGGLIVLFGGHLGVRGDIRYFHSFQDLHPPLITLPNQRVNFGRAAIALMVTF
jgi:opacity protein-like surface antigen